MAGILITRGSRVSIPVDGAVLNLDDDGRVTGGSVNLHVAYDMHPQWLMIAIEHTEKCVEAAKLVDAIWTDGSQPEQVAALEAELREGMQAITAAAIATDSFYSTMKEICPVPKALAEKWREGKTARYKQVAETLRITFNIKQLLFGQIRKGLKQLFDWRDQAVHPTSKSSEPVAHPRLAVSTELRLAVYSSDNAMNVAKFALNLIGLLIAHPPLKKQRLVEHCQFEKTVIYPIIDAWEAKHGQIFDREST